MAMTPLGTPPSTSDPANFATRADTFLASLPTFVTEANALQTDVTTKQQTASTAAITATTKASEASASATAAVAATNVAKWVSGTTYAEGVCVFSPIDYQSYRRKVAGAGTTDPSLDSANWAGFTGPGNHEVVVHTGNGHGSTNTKIRRFTTVLTSVGTAITYADSAASGASFTINETGLYALYYTDTSLGGISYGVSVNSNQLTSDIGLVSMASRLAQTSFGSSVLPVVARVVKLSAGDVIRPHTNGTLDSTQDFTRFAIRKVANA